MKKVLFCMAFVLIAMSCFGQPVIKYSETPILQWDAITVDDTGHPLLSDDVVDYMVYIWDEAKGPIASQVVSNLILVGTTTATELAFVMPYRSTWAGAVRARLTNGLGDVYLAPMAFTTDPPPITKDGAFVVSAPGWVLQKVQSLRLKP